MIKNLLNNIVIAPIDFTVTVSNVSVSSTKLSIDMSNGDNIELFYDYVNVNSNDSISYKINSVKFNKFDVPINNVSRSSYIDIYNLDSIINILKKLYNKYNILRRY